MQLYFAHPKQIAILLFIALLAAGTGLTLALQPMLLVAAGLTIALIIVGIAVIVLLRRDTFLLLAAILVLMPFHTLIDNLLQLRTDSFFVTLGFSVWKEGLLFLLLVTLFTTKHVFKRQPLELRWELVVPLLFMAIGLLYLPTAYSLSKGIHGYRFIFQGLLMLFLIYIMQPPLARVLRLLPWLFAEGAIIALWGIYSRYFMDFYAYLQRFNFIPPSMSREQLQFASVFNISGNLFIRANSIFTGPNEFGLYLAILIVAAIAVLRLRGTQLGRQTRLFYLLVTAMMIGGEIASISRNAWVMVMVATGVLVSQTRGLARKLRAALLLLMVLVVLVLTVPNLRLFIARTIQLEDTSAAGRASELGDRLGILLGNPLGIGLGNANYKLIGNDPEHVHTEFYFMIIGLELGWIGLGLYLAMMALLLLRCLELSASPSSSRRFAVRVAAALLLGTLASQVLAAITMDWLFQYYLWFFVGSALYGRTAEEVHPAGAVVEQRDAFVHSGA